MPTPVYYGAIGIMNAPHMYRPTRRNAVPRRIAAALCATFQRLGDWRERLWTRRQLAHLDDRLLADIGLTRTDVDRQLAKRSGALRALPLRCRRFAGRLG